MERDISIPEFPSLAARFTNIDLWPLLWLLHNASNRVFLLFCLQPENHFLIRKIRSVSEGYGSRASLLYRRCASLHLLTWSPWSTASWINRGPVYSLPPSLDACNRASELSLPLQASSPYHHMCSAVAWRASEKRRKGSRHLKKTSAFLYLLAHWLEEQHTFRVTPCLKSPEIQLLNLTPAVCSLRVSHPLLLIFHRPTSLWSFKSSSALSSRDLPLLPCCSWDLHVMGAAIRAIQTWPSLKLRILNHTGLSRYKTQALQCLKQFSLFCGEMWDISKWNQEWRSSWVQFNSNSSYIPSVKLTSEGEHCWRAVCCLDRHIRIKLLCACPWFVWMLLELHQ